MRCPGCQSECEAGPSRCARCGTPLQLGDEPLPARLDCAVDLDRRGPRLEARGAGHDTPLWDLGSPAWPEPAVIPLARAHSVTGWELGAIVVPGDGLGLEVGPEPPPLPRADEAVVELAPLAGPAPASWWRRVLAAAADLTLLATAAGVPTVGLAVRRPIASSLTPSTALACAGFLALLGFTYGTLGHALMGATLGERLLRLRVVRLDGARVEPGRCAARSALTVLAVAAGGLGVLVGLFTPGRRGLQDLVLGTAVVRAP